MKYEHLLGRTFDGEVYILASDAIEAVNELKQKLQDQCVSCPVKMQEDDVVSELKAWYTKIKEVNTQLKAKLEQEQSLRSHWNEDDYAMVNEIERLFNENADLKRKLENVQASMYADVVDANMENRKLKRALWIARAKRAIEKIAWFKLWNASISTMNPEDGARQEFDKWKKNLGKCLKKAEEYK